jgi:S1-C subfamily serine protease
LFVGRARLSLVGFSGMFAFSVCAADVVHPVVTQPLAPPIPLAPAAAANRLTSATETLDGQGRRRMLGVGVTVLDADSLEAELQGVDHGVKVALVLPGSAAASAGIAVGDILVSLDGEPLSRKGDIQRIVAGRQAGAIVSLHLVRNGTAMDLATQL